MAFLSDVWYTMARRLRFYQRQPVMIFSTIMQPLIWLLLFAPLLQNIALMSGFPTLKYLNFFTPGVIVVLALYSSTFAGFIIASDINFGVLEKIVVTPANRYALMLGEVLSSTVILVLQVLIVFGIALLMGVTIVTGVIGVALILVTVGLLSMGIAALANAFLIIVKKSEAWGAASAVITLPLIFISSILVPSATAPNWLQSAMRFNPINYAVDAIRPLFISGFDWSAMMIDLAVLTLFAIVSVMIATFSFRKYGE